MIYKLCDVIDQVTFITNIGGVGVCSITDQTYMYWLAQGNTPLPADLPTPEQLAAIAQHQADLIEAANAKADAVTKYLVSHTLVEINSYIRNQINTPAVTNLATATTSLKEMENILIKAVAVLSILAKDKLR